MKEKLANNLAVKLLAVVLSVLVWIIVNNIEDPVNEKQFRNITVELKNEEAIASIDKVYEVQSGGVITVTATAKASVLRKLSATDIVAVADLSNLSVTNATYIQLSCPRFENVGLKADVSMLRISLEDEATEQFKVDVNTLGTLPEGYAIGEVRVRPNLIKVSGAKSLIERISEIHVELDVSNMTEGFVRRLEPKVFDANGKLMDSSRMNFSSEEIKVSVSIDETKTIPIEVTTVGEPAEGYHLLSTEFEPKQILVSGKASELVKLNKISIPIDIDGFAVDVETELNLADYLPSGINLVGDVNMVSVKLTISKQEPQRIVLPLNSIVTKNLDEDLELSFEEKNTYVEVFAVLLNPDETRILTQADIQGYIDCENLKAGKRTVELLFEPKEDVNVVSEITLNIKLTKFQEEEEEATVEPIESIEPVTKEPETQEPVITEEPIEKDELEEEENEKEDTKEKNQTESAIEESA